MENYNDDIEDDYDGEYEREDECLYLSESNSELIVNSSIERITEINIMVISLISILIILFIAYIYDIDRFLFNLNMIEYNPLVILVSYIAILIIILYMLGIFIEAIRDFKYLKNMELFF